MMIELKDEGLWTLNHHRVITWSSFYHIHVYRNVISHCIELLKSCHVLTEQLVAYTMESSGMIKSPTEVNNIVAAAKNIRPR